MDSAGCEPWVVQPAKRIRAEGSDGPGRGANPLAMLRPGPSRCVPRCTGCVHRRQWIGSGRLRPHHSRAEAVPQNTSAPIQRCKRRWHFRRAPANRETCCWTIGCRHRVRPHARRDRLADPPSATSRREPLPSRTNCPSPGARRGAGPAPDTAGGADRVGRFVSCRVPPAGASQYHPARSVPTNATVRSRRLLRVP
jgi:hypothetical protein